MHELIAINSWIRQLNPILISGKWTNSALVSTDDWEAIDECPKELD